MWKTIVCILLGHDYSETSEFCGKMENGLDAYKLIIGKCERCGKKPPRWEKTKGNE